MDSIHSNVPSLRQASSQQPPTVSKLQLGKVINKYASSSGNSLKPPSPLPNSDSPPPLNRAYSHLSSKPSLSYYIPPIPNLERSNESSSNGFGTPRPHSPGSPNSPKSSPHSSPSRAGGKSSPLGRKNSGSHSQSPKTTGNSSPLGSHSPKFASPDNDSPKSFTTAPLSNRSPNPDSRHPTKTVLRPQELMPPLNFAKTQEIDDSQTSESPNIQSPVYDPSGSSSSNLMSPKPRRDELLLSLSQIKKDLDMGYQSETPFNKKKSNYESYESDRTTFKRKLGGILSPRDDHPSSKENKDIRKGIRYALDTFSENELFGEIVDKNTHTIIQKRFHHVLEFLKKEQKKNHWFLELKHTLETFVVTKCIEDESEDPLESPERLLELNTLLEKYDRLVGTKDSEGLSKKKINECIKYIVTGSCKNEDDVNFILDALKYIAVMNLNEDLPEKVIIVNKKNAEELNKKLIKEIKSKKFIKDLSVINLKKIHEEVLTTLKLKNESLIKIEKQVDHEGKHWLILSRTPDPEDYIKKILQTPLTPFWHPLLKNRVKETLSIANHCLRKNKMNTTFSSELVDTFLLLDDPSEKKLREWRNCYCQKRQIPGAPTNIAIILTVLKFYQEKKCGITKLLGFLITKDSQNFDLEPLIKQLEFSRGCSDQSERSFLQDQLKLELMKKGSFPLMFKNFDPSPSLPNLSNVKRTFFGSDHLDKNRPVVAEAINIPPLFINHEKIKFDFFDPHMTNKEAQTSIMKQLFCRFVEFGWKGSLSEKVMPGSYEKVSEHPKLPYQNFHQEFSFIKQALSRIDQEAALFVDLETLSEENLQFVLKWITIDNALRARFCIDMLYPKLSFSRDKLSLKQHQNTTQVHIFIETEKKFHCTQIIFYEIHRIDSANLFHECPSLATLRFNFTSTRLENGTVEETLVLEDIKLAKNVGAEDRLKEEVLATEEELLWINEALHYTKDHKYNL